MDKEIVNLTNKLEKKGPPANPETFETIVDALDCNFLPDYLDFMLAHNGAEGEMEESWLKLWPVEEIEEANKGYHGSPDNLPDVLLIGTNGGGEGFGIRKATGVFIQVSLIDMDEENLSEIGRTFKEFLIALNTDFFTRIQGYLSVTGMLRKLDHYLTAQGSIAAANLQAGIPRHEVEQKIASFNITLPPEVYELFEWRNGLKESSDETIGNSLLFPWGIQEPFDRCFSVYKSSSDQKYFPKQYFPIFTSGGGDYILINCDKSDESYGYLYWHSLALYGTERDVRYTSLATLLQCVLECFEAGAYSFVDGALEINHDLADAVLAKYEIPDEGDDDDF
ncbi:SMI1/KNR4 family protein [Chitinophaga ginsengisoli]|uniref:SMI1/KNR4 family protein SUKH-1 n=1 Tax=Chitinophaga ginsengisoli TaxID=363837 RepID=A0A2P8FDT7_9BACT|nr:SMI1/KNR4 family protein [Chitinophaga ginsengisoli]PSL19890.1 SMI1/KNR4 family protein SUKH-1 [Chitinophaga ginsengisoli]